MNKVPLSWSLAEKLPERARERKRERDREREREREREPAAVVPGEGMPAPLGHEPQARKLWGGPSQPYPPTAGYLFTCNHFEYQIFRMIACR